MVGVVGVRADPSGDCRLHMRGGFAICCRFSNSVIRYWGDFANSYMLGRSMCNGNTDEEVAC